MESLVSLCDRKVWLLKMEKEEDIMTDLYFYKKKFRRRIRWFLLIRIYKNMKIIREIVRCRVCKLEKPSSEPPLFPVEDGCVLYHINKLWEEANVISFRTMNRIILQTKKKHHTAVSQWWLHFIRWHRVLKLQKRDFWRHHPYSK
jgi:hypothetical protein